MIKECPICGTSIGLTHGDQAWEKEVCEGCLEEFGEEKCEEIMKRKTPWEISK